LDDPVPVVGITVDLALSGLVPFVLLAEFVVGGALIVALLMKSESVFKESVYNLYLYTNL
jgi:hypothetical protein